MFLYSLMGVTESLKSICIPLGIQGPVFETSDLGSAICDFLPILPVPCSALLGRVLSPGMACTFTPEASAHWVGLPVKDGQSFLLTFTIRHSNTKGAVESPQGLPPHGSPVPLKGQLSLSISILSPFPLAPQKLQGRLSFQVTWTYHDPSGVTLHRYYLFQVYSASQGI